MFPYVNIYLYRVTSPRNVLDSWSGCVAVPPVGDTIQLSAAPDASDWQVQRVIWAKPDPESGQVVDILVTPISKSVLL